MNFRRLKKNDMFLLEDRIPCGTLNIRSQKSNVLLLDRLWRMSDHDLYYYIVMGACLLMVVKRSSMFVHKLNQTEFFKRIWDHFVSASVIRLPRISLFLRVNYRYTVSSTSVDILHGIGQNCGVWPPVIEAYNVCFSTGMTAIYVIETKKKIK